MIEKLNTLETGLRGIPVGYCPTSYVDPEKGLFYGEYPIREVAFWEPEEVLYLLIHGERGSQTEVKEFSAQLKKEEVLSKESIRAIEGLPKQGDPMKLFSAALLLLGTLEGKGDYRADCIALIAKIPHLTAILINHHGGFGRTPSPDKNLSYMDNFVHMLRIPNTDSERLRKILTLYNILHYDHGGGNLSTFVGKAVASGLEDLFGSIAAAMSALAGPRHGKANQESLHFVKQAFDACKGDGNEENIEAFLREKIFNKELIFGFGHAVLRVEDPRATVQYELAEKLYPDHPLVKIALLLRKVGPRVLKENPKISNPYPNVDAISGTLLTAAGFTQNVYYTPLFGLSRSCGIAIQIVYERCYAREGRGTPIVRPKYIYKPYKR
ncbi:MAG: citrate (Si)-synthase [Chlamydiia bacterium]|nr:citrate (Si)-synthase [Chlamydiia bacterium]